MVFESVVVDVLNRFLGDYVVDLDTSQLSLGIWGGDVVLKHLVIKENALSQLDVPFRIKVGHIGHLELKIPWKNLYTQPVQAVLEDIYVLIVPSSIIQYDAIKEEKQLFEAKQRELKRIEDAKQKVAAKGKEQVEKQDTFTEKLITQIIKNLQVKISNIHIRYEDDITNQRNPLSFGISLQNLSLETTNQNWVPHFHADTEKLFYKLIRLDNLFAYWNVKSQMFYHDDSKISLANLKNGIVKENAVPRGYESVFRPISADAKLQMNRRSDFDFSAPKMNLEIELHDIAIEFKKSQYFSVMELLESIDMMTQNLPYRKFKPDVPLHKNARKWWAYAIHGVLEVNVIPRLQMWSWKHILKHRLKMKQYKELYKKKLTIRKPSFEVLNSLEDLEKSLDVFNIVISRQQAEVEAKKAGHKLYKEGVEEDSEENKGWFNWLWTWSEPPQTKEQPNVKPGTILEEMLTVEEKTVLYEAIGYSETAVDPTLPKTFEAMKVFVHLKSMSIVLREKQEKSELLDIVVEEFSSMIVQRPGAQAFKFEIRVGSFHVTGSPDHSTKPRLLSSLNDATSLFQIIFEINPLDETVAQRCIIEAEPVEIIYDARTVNSTIEFFRPPEQVNLTQLTSATLTKLEEFREKTSTGLVYIIETQKVLDLRINWKASYVVIPQDGIFSPTSNLLLLDLGHLKVTSKSRSELPVIQAGANLEDIMHRAYDSFDFQLTSVQLLYSKVGDDWKEARKRNLSAQHILVPMHFNVEVSKAMVFTDIRMPKFKVFGKLPLISLVISDQKLQGILDLIDSIPKPSSESKEHDTRKTSQLQRSISLGTTQMPQKVLPLLELAYIEEDSEDEFFDAPCSPLDESHFPPIRSKNNTQRKPPKTESLKNMTQCKMRFEVPEVLVQFCRLVEDYDLPVVEISVLGLGTDVEFRTYDLKASAFLKEFCLKCPEYLYNNEKPVYLITTLDNTMEDLLTLEYVKTEENIPYLKSTSNNVMQLIKVNFSSLDIHLHTEALLNTINYFSNIVIQLEEKTASLYVAETEDKEDVIKKLSSKLPKNEDVVIFQILAELSCLQIFIEDQKHNISEIKIEGLDSELVMKPSVMEITVKLRNIVVLDSDTKAVYKKALYITEKEVFSFKMFSYVDATVGAAYTDMNVVDLRINLTVGCIEVVLITNFLYSILTFVDNFQAVKQALAEATAQAAGMAAAGVQELAQRSTRMALDINIKAPVVVIPQSPVSENVFVADFGLITMTNKFSMIKESQSKMPPIMDLITIRLSKVRLYRTQFINDAYQKVLNLLMPLNLEVVVERNLSWEWFQEIPFFNINAQLKPMELVLSQEDLTTLFKTLYGNIWFQPLADSSNAKVVNQSSAMSEAIIASDLSGGTTVVTAAVVETYPRASQIKTMINLTFRTDYLTMVLYGPHPDQTSFMEFRDPTLVLAEFKLENILSTVKVHTDDSMLSSFSLKNCILDDKRPHVKNATSRMIGLTVGFDKKDMLDIKCKKIKDIFLADIVVQETYMCASVEFLLIVANVFWEAFNTGRTIETSVQTRTAAEEAPPSGKWEINIIIKNPEIVFVADMTRSDAPALVITTQCEICCKGDSENSTMTAAIKDLQMRACSFLPVKRKGRITTVLQPCDLFFQATQSGTNPQVVDVSVKSLTLKVSPVIINTVITITSALSTSKEVVSKQDVSMAHLWEMKDTKTLKMWFLEEASEAEKIVPTTELIPKGETMRVNIDSIFIVMEAGVGHRTVPMLLAKSRALVEAKNWSSLINLHCQLELEVHYYNEMFGVWEPLLEPLEIDKTEDFRPWNLGVKIKKKPKKAIFESDTEEENYKVPEYKTVIGFHSKDQLNITLSKCGLIMLNNLAKAFTEAATGSSAPVLRDLAPFMILNSLGLTISVSPSDSFSVLNISKAKAYTLKNEENLTMDYARTKDNDHFNAMTSLSSKLFYILIKPASHSTTDKIPLTKVGRRLFTVRHRESGVERSIVCQIETIEGSKKLTIRSPVQIRNHFSVPLAVYDGDTSLGIASPGNEFNVPLPSYRSHLSLKPHETDYQKCEGFNFEDIVKYDATVIKKKCRSSNPSVKPFIINIVPEKDNLTSLSVYSEDCWDLPYIIHLWPPILLRNNLPYKIVYYVEGTENKVFTLNEGQSTQICNAQLDKTKLHLKLVDYLNHDWKSEYHIKRNQQEISFINFTCVTEIEKTDLDIAIHVAYNTGQTLVEFHSPYWMVNKTGRMLQYKADGIHRKHPPNYKKPILFSFQPKHFFNNNKVQLMVTDSELSDEFSIDTVGTHGAVKCKGLKKEYQVGVTIQLSSFNITRIVTFTPFYMVENKSKYKVSVSEEGSDKWLSLELDQCLPFWPETTSNKLLVQVERSNPPQKIYFTKHENCILLRLGNELGGIIAEVNVAEHSTVITFSDYHDGAATFLLINHTKNEIIHYRQSSLSETEDHLLPGKAVLYTWADPVGSRKLKWKCGSSHGEVTQKDDMMTPISVGKKTIYLVSFFEGLQRIILFTEDPKVFKVTYESEKAEIAEQEIVLALQDVGISLVNNYTKEEVAYIGITSSDVVWEIKPKKKARWKPMSVKHTEKLEKEFKDYIESSPAEDKLVELDTNVPVRFTPSGTNMKILQPHVIAIRRNYLPALKVEYNSSAHQSSFRIQIYRVQIQNQIHGAIFPFVFYPIKPPKSVTMDSAPKPFIDVSIVMRTAGHSHITLIKYFKVLIQEMDLRLDLGFIYALAELITEAGAEKTEVENFQKDLQSFLDDCRTVSFVDSSPVGFYEYFHISPIKLHLSVSLSSGKETKDSGQNGALIAVYSLNLLLKSIGATLTDIQDVIFKLAFFELNYQFQTTSELQSEVIKHYSKQAIKQMYVLILGLEVLGNPFGLIREFSEGVEAFFYEPYQGAIQGPEEFVEGMALGLKALVGGAVGGLAGAASKITGAMAKGVAAMTLDEDYQQKRREAMNKQPAGLREGITRGGKGLVSGFVSGITGIVTKPIKGAQKEGAAGFFKGVGKGLVGAVARPTGGIIDMASSTFQGIKRATETSDEVESLRPPRFFNEDGIIRPYRLRDGAGNQMLQVLEDGRFATCKYFTHVMINKSDIFMITKSGVLFITKGTFGQLTCEWQYSFDEFTKEPFIVHGRRLRIEAKERVTPVFHAKEFGKIINFKTPEDARWILTKLEEAREHPSPNL